MKMTNYVDGFRFFRIICSITCLGLILSACAPQKFSTATSTPAVIQTAIPILPTASPTAAPDIPGVEIENLKGLQIHFTHPWMGSTQDELFRMVDEFNQNNQWGVFVIMDPAGSTGQLEQDVWRGLQNGDAANVIAAPVSLLQAVHEKYASVIDLDQYINSSTFAMRREDFNPIFWSNNLVKGKRLGVPAQETAAVLFYNSTWARELGFSKVPGTPEELQEQVCAANQSMRKDNDPANDGLGGLLVSNDSSSMYAWLMSFNTGSNFEGAFTFNTPETKSALKFLLQLKSSSCTWSGKTPEPYDYFATRKALMYSGQMQDIYSQSAANNRAGSTDEWSILPYPGVERPAAVVSGNSYGIIHKDTASDLASWLFIRWLSEPAQQFRLGVTFGTLPLGEQSDALLHASSALPPPWFQFVDSQTNFINEPNTADWIVVKTILEDAGWQLFKTEMKEDQIPAMLQQMDDLAVELSERYP